LVCQTIRLAINDFDLFLASRGVQATERRAS